MDATNVTEENEEETRGRCHCGQMWEGRRLCEACQVKLKRRGGAGESSRCGDQVFGSRVTTSTLAGEYVTARDYVGGRASCGNCGTRTSCTRLGLRGKLRWKMYALLKKGAADYGARGRYDPPKLGFPCFPSCSVCCVRARGDRGRHGRGGR